ncbi:hypothetical protein AMST5_00179 [freshwater sediment metagenome]|uniref:Uncharacterized protein n=1 Tax=freshwater sediment metagenome TaxID=556182 RepID=A0AA48LWV6_9ZZZZ
MTISDGLAQVPGEVKKGTMKAQDITKVLGEISKSLGKLKDDNGNLYFAKLTQFTAAIGDFAPAITALTIAFDLAGYNTEKTEDKILKGVQTVNQKVDDLSAKLGILFDNSKADVSVEVDWALIKTNVAEITNKGKYVDTFSSMTQDIVFPTYDADQLNDSLGKAAEVLGNLCKGAARLDKTDKKPVNTDIIQNVATNSYGDIDQITATGVYLTYYILQARDTFQKLYVISENGRRANGTSQFSSDTAVLNKSVELTKDFADRADQCTKRTEEVARQNAEPAQQKRNIERRLASFFSASLTSDAVLKNLSDRYPYLDWFVLRYPGVYGSDKHYVTIGNNVVFFARVKPENPNFLIGFAEKGRNYRPDLWTDGCGNAAKNLKFNADLLNKDDVDNGHAAKFDTYFSSLGNESDRVQTTQGGFNETSDLSKAQSFLNANCSNGVSAVDSFWIGENKGVSGYTFSETSLTPPAKSKGFLMLKGDKYTHIAILNDSDSYIDSDDYIKRYKSFFVQNLASQAFLGASQQQDILVSTNAPAWQFEPAADGYFYVRSTVTGKYIGYNNPAFTLSLGARYIPDFVQYAATYGASAPYSFQWRFERVDGDGNLFRISNRLKPYYFLSDERPWLELTQGMGELASAHAQWKLSRTN